MKMTIICEYRTKKKSFFRQFLVLIIVTLAFYLPVNAQNMLRNISYELPQIRTVQICSANDSLAIPAVALGADDYIILQFDELEADVRSLYFTLRHCNIDWTPSDLLDIEFFDGFNKVYDAEQYMLSFNTITDYTHYRLSVSTEPIKVSGNYILSVFSADDDTELLRRPFFVYESAIGIQSRITRQSVSEPAFQTLSFSVLHPQLHTNNAAIEFKAAVWQNCRPDTWTVIEQPSFVRQNELTYDNAMSFDAGNEYRWADNRSLKYNGINVHHIQYHNPFYHVTLNTDRPDAGYSFHEDFNGKQYIEARDIYRSPLYAADYTMVHFSLLTDKVDGDVYVFGELSDFRFDDSNRMTYDATDHCYHLTLRLKQGLHNYQYVMVDRKGKVSTYKTDGSFADTENDYYIAVYYRGLSDTFDRLVGYRRHNSKRTPNAFIH